MRIRPVSCDVRAAILHLWSQRSERHPAATTSEASVLHASEDRIGESLDQGGLEPGGANVERVRVSPRCGDGWLTASLARCPSQPAPQPDHDVPPGHVLHVLAVGLAKLLHEVAIRLDHSHVIDGNGKDAGEIDAPMLR